MACRSFVKQSCTLERIQDRHDERVESARFFDDGASALWRALRPSFQESPRAQSTP